MPQLVPVTMKLKTDELKSSLLLLRRYSERLPSYLANKAGRFIALKAERNMPVTSPDRIETELNAAVELVRSKKGGRFRRAIKFQRAHRTFGGIGSDRAYKSEYATIPLLALIIQARARPGSKYNISTGSVFAGPSPFKGVSREAGAQLMLATMRRVFSARKSSTGFFKVCATLVGLLFNEALSGQATGPALESGLADVTVKRGGNVTRSKGRLADVMPATGTSDNVRASFWVATTEPDTKGQGGRALREVAQPVWQAAVNSEAASIMAEAEKRYVMAIRRARITV